MKALSGYLQRFLDRVQCRQQTYGHPVCVKVLMRHLRATRLSACLLQREQQCEELLFFLPPRCWWLPLTHDPFFVYLRQSQARKNNHYLGKCWVSLVQWKMKCAVYCGTKFSRKLIAKDWTVFCILEELSCDR